MTSSNSNDDQKPLWEHLFKNSKLFSDKSLWMVSAHIPSILPVFMLISKTKHIFVVVLFLIKNKRQSIIREVQIIVKKFLCYVL